MRQVLLDAVERHTLLDQRQVARQVVVRPRRLPEGAAGALAGTRSRRHFATRVDLGRPGVCDVLLRGRKVAPERFDLIAEQLRTHRVLRIGAEDVEGTSAHCELTAIRRYIHTLVSHAYERRRELGQVERSADLEQDGIEDMRAVRRQDAQDRSCAGDDDHRPPAVERVQRAGAGAYRLEVGGSTIPRHLDALRKVQHALMSHVGAQLTGESRCGIVAGHHDQDRFGAGVGDHCGEDRPNEAGRSKGDVFAGVEPLETAGECRLGPQQRGYRVVERFHGNAPGLS